MLKKLLPPSSLTLSLALPLALVAGILEGSQRVVLLTVGFSLLILIHELGHFLVARACGVRCETFSLGIGPRLLGWRKGVGLTFGTEREVTPDQPGIGETDYRLSCLPLGGYVRMLGQDDTDTSAVSDDPRSFTSKTIPQRMAIVSAGVIMNLILGAIIFSLVFKIGVPFPPALLGRIEYNSPAEKAGLQIGDRILRIDGRSPRGFLEFTDLVLASALSTDKHPLTLDVQRGEQEFQVQVTPQPKVGGPYRSIGVETYSTLKVPVLENLKNAEDRADLLARFPLFKELHGGEEIVAVNGEKVENFAELYHQLQNLSTLTMDVSFREPSGAIKRLRGESELQQRPGAEKLSMLGLIPRARVVWVEPGGPGAQAGLQSGDIIERIGTQAHPTTEQVRQTIRENASQSVEILVLRGSATQTLKATPMKKSGMGLLNIQLGLDMEHLDLAAVEAGSPAMKAGLTPGQRITAINGQAVSNWIELYQAARRQDLLKIKLADPAMPELTWALDETQKKQLQQWEISWHFPLEPYLQVQRASSLGGALLMGMDHTRNFILQFYQTLRALFVRSVPASELHGIVGMAKWGYQVQERGVMYLLFFLGVISVNLAVANFLPLPIVDGGLFVLLILEKIRGRPLPMKVQVAIQYVGLAIFAGLFLFVTYNDLQLFFTF